MADDDRYFSKHFFLGVLFALIILALYVISPVITALLTGGVLAYIFYPLYKYVAKNLRSKRIGAWVIIILLIVLIIVPTYLVANELTKEGFSLFITVKQKLATGLPEADCIQHPAAFCEFNNRLSQLVQNPQVKFYIEDTISKISTYIISKTSDLVVQLPYIVLFLVVMFFAAYYFLMDGDKFISYAKRSIPLKKHHIDEIIRQFDNFTYATLYGKLVTSIIQGVIGGFIFFALGIATPILAGIAMAFFAFLPVIGTPIIWIPAAITLFLEGSAAKGIILVALCVIMGASIDNILKPAIIGSRTHLHPIAVLIGIFGGLITIGPIGIILGPLIISLMLSFIDVYYKEGL